MTLEAILGLLVLVILFVAVLEFGIAGTVRHAVSHAATVGAREAGKGADINQLALVVEEVLSPHNLMLGPSATVILEDPAAVLPADQIQRAGTLACDPPAMPALTLRDVRVTVCVRADTEPFINGLAPFGVDISQRLITVSTVVRKEQ